MSTASNMTLIETKTVGAGGSSTIDFTGIPATFTDVVIVASLRSNRADTNDYLQYVKFNSSTSGYSSRNLWGTGSSVSSNTSDVATITASTSTSNTFSNLSIYVPNYAGSTNKSYSVDGVDENNATASGQMISAGLWANTAAVTSISLVPKIGTLFVEGSTASLYGIKSSSKLITAKATGGIIYQSGSYMLAKSLTTPEGGLGSVDC